MVASGRAAASPREGSAPQRLEPRRATYRVQLHAGFGFDAAAAIADYLSALGVSHLYCSPYLQAAAGSTHGYDVVDHTRLNDELGGDAAHARMVHALASSGLRQLLDIVPNHMAVGDRRNRWWWDVLEDGAASVYASYFDVDWDPPESKLRDQILVPILGDHYGRILEAGELHLEREKDGGFVVRYHEHVLPISLATVGDLLDTAAERAGSGELAGLARRCAALDDAFGVPARTLALADPSLRRRRYEDRIALHAALGSLCRSDASVEAAIGQQLEACNRSHAALHELLERQSYRLAFWRAASHDLVYRRFFDINTLAALRTERREVFEDTHALVLRLVCDGIVDGLRIDHPDGLADPEEYLRRLADASGGAWVIVEKILETGESLPASWATAGTTGYDFCTRVSGLFVDPLGEMAMTSAYRRFSGAEDDFAQVAYAKKHQVMREILAADVNRLTELAVRVCDRHPRYRDYSRHDLHEALRELLACLPVYRTYVRPQAGGGGAQPRSDDQLYVAAAIAEAARRRPDIDRELLDFLGEVLLGREPGVLEDLFVTRFQQASGPIMAKGVEDTAFYVYVRLTSLNEVGGSPGHFGTSVEELHEANAAAAERWPEGLLATSTHDTKRSEDVRARVALLSEIPDDWAQTVERWRVITSSSRGELVDGNAEWLFYQTLVGAWPIGVDRAVAYMQKATKEAKARTSWTDPNAAYDDAVAAFVTGALGDPSFVAAVDSFVAPLVRAGRINSLALTLLKLFSPGVADIYQGCELWDLSLVDPDNRRPVDFELRRRLLASLPARGGAAAVWSRDDEGSAKLLVIARGLAARRRAEPLESYQPLWATGPAAGHAVAFARSARAIVVVPRLVLGLERRGGWGETTLALPDGRWRDVFTDIEHQGVVTMDALSSPSFPVSLLEASP